MSKTNKSNYKQAYIVEIIYTLKDEAGLVSKQKFESYTLGEDEANELAKAMKAILPKELEVSIKEAWL